MYLFALVTAVFGNFFVRTPLQDSSSAAVTAQNIIDSEYLFRIGLACELAGFAAIVLLAVSLYTVLKPVDRTLALLGLGWWIAEACILAVILTLSFSVLLMFDDAGISSAFEVEQRDVFVAFNMRLFYYAYDIGIVFFGLGSTVFSYLLFRSRYIPRLLAGWGIFASLCAVISVFVMTIAPDTTQFLGIASVAPIFLYELIAGLWLLILGAKIQYPP